VGSTAGMQPAVSGRCACATEQPRASGWRLRQKDLQAGLLSPGPGDPGPVSCVWLCKSGLAIMQGGVPDVKAIDRSGGAWTRLHLNWGAPTMHLFRCKIQSSQAHPTP